MTPGLKTSPTLITPNYAIENAHLVSSGWRQCNPGVTGFGMPELAVIVSC
jgi:hypothetical protein